jgi:hypothetical protein
MSLLIIPDANDRALFPCTISASSHILPRKSYLANHLMYESIPWYEFDLILLYLKTMTILFFSNLVDWIPPNWEDPLHFMRMKLHSSCRLGNTRLRLEFCHTQLVWPFDPILPCARQTININGVILWMAASLVAVMCWVTYVACVRCQTVVGGYERIVQPLLEIERGILELVQIHFSGIHITGTQFYCCDITEGNKWLDEMN